MAASTKLFLLCALFYVRLSKQSPSGAHHREHKVHNIVLYPDKHSWCKTTTIKQVINYPGCVSAEINNNVCVGACFSYSIPRTEPSDPGEVIVPYCDSCQPSATTWHQITLQCDDNKSDAPPLLVKHVQIIHNCSCTLCDERFKIGNKVTYDIINNMDAEPDDIASNIKVASDLMLLQNVHAAQAYNTDIDGSTNSSGNTSSSSIALSASSGVSSESATEILRSKRMQRILNQKIIALLTEIQQHNRPADKEQLLDLLHVAEHDMADDTTSIASKSVKLLLDEIKQSLESEENLTASNVHRIRDLLQEMHNFKLQRVAGDCNNHHADLLDGFNDEDSSYNDDNVQQFVGNDLDNIAQQTSRETNWQEDHENKNEDTNTDEAATAGEFMLPIWLHDVNNAAAPGDNNISSNSNQQHVIEITDIVEQREHEQHATAEEKLQIHHQKEHQHQHQLAQHHKREHDEANAVHKRHHHQQYHQHNHHHNHHHQQEQQHYSKLEPQDEEELTPAVPPPSLTTPDFLTNDGLLLHRQHQLNVQLRKQLDVNAHELKPNHAGTLLSYHSHVAQSDEEATVVADDDD